MTPLDAAREDAAKDFERNAMDRNAAMCRSGEFDNNPCVKDRLSAINLYLASQQANAPELVERFRFEEGGLYQNHIGIIYSDKRGDLVRYKDHADALTAAHAQIAELRKALEPFAKDADYYDPPENDDDLQAFATNYRIGQLRAARAAIGGGQ